MQIHTDLSFARKRTCIQNLVLICASLSHFINSPLLSPPLLLYNRIKFEALQPNFLRLWLSTQAGTYIKEFVHGDLGRTQPNLTTLLDCDTDILTLDVEVRFKMCSLAWKEVNRLEDVGEMMGSFVLIFWFCFINLSFSLLSRRLIWHGHQEWIIDIS